jgi:GNAT superfamily N-acetyltransferase
MHARVLASHEGDVLVAAALAADGDEVPLDRARSLLADPGWVAAVAFDPEPVGLGYGHVLRLLRGDSLMLYSMDVAEAHRRRGCGSAIVEALKAFCVERKLFEMFVLTERSNLAAMRLYASTGGRDDPPDVAQFDWPTPGVERGWN